MLLKNKNAVVYGAGGGIGSAVSAAFAREGARVFLVGRTRARLEAVAKEIEAHGGRADVDVVDAFDAAAVDAHARDVVARGGSLDVSLNLVTRRDVQGIPLIDMDPEEYMRPLAEGVRSLFLTACAAGRHMAEQGSGVILALDSGSAKASPGMGGTCPADAASDTLIRQLALELGPKGVRALGIWAAGVPETLTPEKLGAVDSRLRDAAAFQGVLDHLDSLRMLPASPPLERIADLAAFLASDRAGAVTGSFVNATAMFPS